MLTLDPQGPASARGRRRGRPALVAAVAVVALLGLVTCLAHLGAATTGVDEPAYVDAGRAYLDGDRSANREHPYLAKQLIGLAQVVLGDSLLASRVPSALLGWLTGLVVGLTAWRLSGRVAGVAAAALWLLLPQAPGTVQVRLDRYAALDPAAAALLAVAVLLAVLAAQRRSRPLLLAAAACAGLAASAKLPGGVALLPVLAVALTGAGPAARRLRDAAAAAGTAAAAFWLPYAVQGDPSVQGLRYALRFQLDHARDGHRQVVAGEVYERAPTWAHWVWQADYLGVPGAVALWALALVGLAAWARSPGRAVPLATAGVALGAALLLVTAGSLRLPHYHLLWVGPLVVAAGAGAAHLLRGTPAARSVGALLLLPLALLAGRTVVDAATLAPTDYARVQALLEAEGMPAGPVAVWGWPGVAARHLDPARYPVTGLTPEQQAVAVVVDPVTAERQQDTVAVDWARADTAGCTPRAVDRLTVWLCRAPG